MEALALAFGRASNRARASGQTIKIVSRWWTSRLFVALPYDRALREQNNGAIDVAVFYADGSWEWCRDARQVI